MFKQKRNINIASVICIVVILIVTITETITACRPPVDETYVSTESEGPMVLQVETDIFNPKDNKLKEINQTDDIVIEKDSITIKRDYEIIMPTDDEIKLIEVFPKHFTLDQMYKMVELVNPNKPLYDFFDHSEFDVTWSVFEDDNDKLISLLSPTDDGREILFDINQSEDGMDQLSFQYTNDMSIPAYSEYEGQDIEGMEKSYVECLDIAKEFIAELDGEDSFRYILTPMWEFDCEVKYSDFFTDDYFNTHGIYYYTHGNYRFLTINALDGSIVN